MYTSLPGCVGIAGQSDACIYFDWQSTLTVPLEPLGASGLANVPHKCTLIGFFCKVNNFELMNIFSRWWIIGCFQTHCQSSKLTIRDIYFKTKLISIVNTQGLTGGAVTVGAITDLKHFFFFFFFFLGGGGGGGGYIQGRFVCYI